MAMWSLDATTTTTSTMTRKKKYNSVGKKSVPINLTKIMFFYQNLHESTIKVYSNIKICLLPTRICINMMFVCVFMVKRVVSIGIVASHDIRLHCRWLEMGWVTNVWRWWCRWMETKCKKGGSMAGHLRCHETLRPIVNRLWNIFARWNYKEILLILIWFDIWLCMVWSTSHTYE